MERLGRSCRLWSTWEEVRPVLVEVDLVTDLLGKRCPPSIKGYRIERLTSCQVW